MALGRKNKKIHQRHWRPDFRDVNTLPDTKVIRTGFLLNFVAIALTLGVVSLYIIREYSLQAVSESVSSLEVEVANNTARNRQILDDNKTFTQKAEVLKEVIAFDRQAISYPLFLKEVSAIRPETILVDGIKMGRQESASRKDFKGPFIVDISGKIEKSGDLTPSQVISGFQKAFDGLSSLEGKSLEMDLIRFNRNNELGHFDFTLQVLITPKAGTES